MRYPSLPYKAGFSLAEVTLALGIAAFCLIAIFGLLPVGLTNNQNSTEQTTAASIVTGVVADMRATPSTTSTSGLYGVALPVAGSTVASPQHFYFDANGSNKDASGTAYTSNTGLFRVSVGITPPATGLKNATAIRILVTWPASATTVINNIWPTKFSGSFETFTALNRN